ncbi:hypothetical protein CKU_2506 [Staphylococcus aureus]|nr:hypothetical protein CKU_2506 [Staphylococcus aureus]
MINFQMLINPFKSTFLRFLKIFFNLFSKKTVHYANMSV